jgi:hypothetical protein
MIHARSLKAILNGLGASTEKGRETKEEKPIR